MFYMKYSLYEECVHNFSNVRFSSEELNIIQDCFHIYPGGKYDENDKFIKKSVNNSKYDYFKINSSYISYITEDIYFGYLFSVNLKGGHLVLNKDDGIYSVLISNQEFSIKYYDSYALSFIKQKNGNVDIDYNIIEVFNKLGILPDKQYECEISLLVLDHFNIIKLLMTQNGVFNDLFSGNNIHDLLNKQEYGSEKKKIK